MKVEDFLSNENKRGTCISIIRCRGIKRAEDYIIGWTDCSQEEAESIISALHGSEEYRNHLKEVRSIQISEANRKRREEIRRSIMQRLYSSASDRTVSMEKTTPVTLKKDSSCENKRVCTEEPKNLYLIDGDNNIKEATERFELADDTDIIKIFVSQKGLYNKLLKKNYPHTSVIFVESKQAGDQAVDNRIKAELGNAVKQKYGDIFVISRDKGYEKLLQKYRCEYGRKKGTLDRRDMF